MQRIAKNIQEASVPRNNTITLGIAGYGVVGAGLVRTIVANSDLILRRTGKRVVLKTVLERNAERARIHPLPEGTRLTANVEDIIGDPEIDIVAELIGGTTFAHDLIHAALSAGKHVVTANKALLAENGIELFNLAAAKNLHIGYEASVAGGIPIVQALREGLAGNAIEALSAILNGTSNYILTEMSDKGLSFEAALQEAQRLGYAEADPTLDIDGCDAAHKLTLLIRLAWGLDYPCAALPVEGIRKVQFEDIAFARELGYSIKLVAQAFMADGKIEAGVFPTLVHDSFLLSRVSGSFNAIWLTGNAVGSIFLHGRGAGDTPTGSAVLSDILAVARGAMPNNTGFTEQTPPPAARKNPADAESLYYFRLLVPDRAGVLRDVAGAMAENGISIAQAIQKGKNTEAVPLVFMTHSATARAVEKAVARIGEMGLLHATPVCYRVIAPE